MKEFARLWIFLTCFAGLLFSGCGEEPAPDPFVPYVWPVKSPVSAGMDAGVLDSAFSQAAGTGFIDGLLVVKDGFLIQEDYYNGFSKDHPHNIMSVSKSFLSAIAGIALEQGYIDSLGERMLDYFPEYVFEGIDPRKYNITIRHLLTMRMGIDGESNNDYSVYQEIYTSDNWIKKTIEYPLVNDPGEKMRYNTFQTHLLSGILEKATGMSTRRFAKKYLFNPAGIDVDYWEQDPQGYYFGGNSMHFTPREMAVLGYLYLNGGILDGKQIIQQAWIDLTLSASTDFTHPNEWGTWKNYNYAYLWWLGEMNDHDLFMAYGYGGQFVMVFPGLNLVIVSTAEGYVDSETSTEQEWAIFDLVSRYILPAVND